MRRAAFKIRNVPLLTMEELAGVGMIQDLQRMQKIEEPFNKALEGWRKMSPDQKEATKVAHKFFRESRN